MAQTKHQIQALLSSASTEPRHRFGQNFMIDQNLVRLIADAAELTDADCAFEVGPGTGTLTEELLQRAGRVIAVEIDRNLAELLRSQYAANEKFLLIEGDALAGKHELNPLLLAEVKAAQARQQPAKLVANLPYNIASPLVVELLIAGVTSLTFTVQKEVALRLKASAGSDDYGPLSVMAQLLSHVRLLRTLPPQAFWPAPRIESGLVCMIRSDRLREKALAFGAFVHAVFSYRRKMLRKALAEAGLDSERVLEVTGFDGKRRPEEFTPEELLILFDASQDAA